VLPQIDEADSGWFADVQRIALHLAKVHSAYDREFVIGLSLAPAADEHVSQPSVA